MLFSTTQFSGIAPKLSPYKLPQSNAQIAQNVRLAARTLKPWKTPATVKSGLAAGEGTIYRFGHALSSDVNYWFHWLHDVDVAKGALLGDATERTYFCHPVLGPRVTNNSLALTGGAGDYPWNSYKLGVPAPASAPSVNSAVGGTGTPESRVYCFTYLSALGEEGPPSPVSGAYDVLPGGTVTLGDLGTAAPAGYEASITAKRIYRTTSGNLATEFQLVDEIPIAQATYNDSVLEAQEVIPSVTWDKPPDGCFGMCQMANGIMLVCKGYDVYASEAYRPHAYPTDYIQPTDYPIVGAAAFGSSAVICTTGNPYILTGSDPSSLTMDNTGFAQACVAKRSIVGAGDGVMYASPDGLCYVGAGGARVATEQLFSRDEWQLFNPSSIHGYLHENRYIGFYDTGTAQGGFVFDPAEGDAAFTLIDLYATAGFSDLVQDALFLKVGSEIVKWHHGGANMTYTWKSAPQQMPAPTNLGAAQVVASAYPVTLKVYADGVLKLTKTVAGREPFRLPSGFRARYYEFEVSGSNEVSAVHLATSIQELQQATP